MTIEASVKRGMERQKLIGSLMEEIRNEEGRRDREERRGAGHTFLSGLVMAIYECLQQRRRNAPRHEIAEETPFFIGIVLPRIKGFSRSQTEEDALVAELLEMVVRSATSHFHLALQTEQIIDPARIFHAPSAITRVPIE